MNRYISTGSLFALLLATLLVGGISYLVKIGHDKPTFAAAPAFAGPRHESPTPDVADIPHVWKGFLAAADAGDLIRLRGYVPPGAGVDAASPNAQRLVNAFCKFMVEAAAAHHAAEAKFGQLPAEHALFFAHNDLELLTQNPGQHLATICSVLPSCSDRDDPAFIEVRQISAQWFVTIGQARHGTHAGDPAATTADRLERAAVVFRAAAGDIQAGAYANAQAAIVAIQDNLLRAGAEAIQLSQAQ